MKLLSSVTRSHVPQLVYSGTSLLLGLAFWLTSHSVLAQGIYATPGLYTYTVPAGGPFQIRVTARGGDGGGQIYYPDNPQSGGVGATVSETFTVQSGDVLTLLVGQSGGNAFIIERVPSNGGGGGGSAVVLTRNGTRSLLVAAGGGGGGGSFVRAGDGSVNLFSGGGGQGLGPSTGGAGGVPGGGGYYVIDYSGSGGGGGLAGPGGNGQASSMYDDPGGVGGGRASLIAVSPGGIYSLNPNGYGGSGFGGGGSIGGYGNGSYPIAAGGGGGGYGGGNGGAIIMNQQNRITGITRATGGYSYVSPAGSATTITPGANGAGTSHNGEVVLSFPNNTPTAVFTTTNRSICPGFSTTLEGTVSATGSWTVVLSDGTVGMGSGSKFSIPVSPVSSTTYTIQSVTDQLHAPNVNNLTSKATVTVSTAPTVTLTSNGPVTCKPSSATLTATGTGSSYTFTQGNTILPGNPASNTRTISNPGAYTVRVSGVGSCTNSASINVNQVIVPPVLAISTPNGTQLSCSQPYVQLLAYGNPGAANSITSYTYTYGNTLLPGDPYNRSQFVTIPGVYTVRVTGVNSCTNVESVTITQLQQTPPTVSLTNNGPLTCAKPSVTLTATGTGTSYVFTGAGTTLAGQPSSNTRVVSSPGTYTVVVTGANDCTNMATTTVGSTAATVNVTNPVTTSLVVNQAVNRTFTASGGASPYSFSVASGSLPSGLSLSTTGQLSGTLAQAGNFTVVVQARDVNGCTAQGPPYVVHVANFTTSDLTPILYARPSTVYGNAPLTVVVDVVELNGLASQGLITLRITRDALLSLSFAPTATSIGTGPSAVPVQNSYWTQQADAGGYAIFTTSQTIVAGNRISLGLTGTLAPGASTGNLTISATIEGGGELKLNNNIDADKLDYFQQ